MPEQDGLPDQQPDDVVQDDVAAEPDAESLEVTGETDRETPSQEDEQTQEEQPSQPEPMITFKGRQIPLSEFESYVENIEKKDAASTRRYQEVAARERAHQSNLKRLQELEQAELLRQMEAVPLPDAPLPPDRPDRPLPDDYEGDPDAYRNALEKYKADLKQYEAQRAKFAEESRSYPLRLEEARAKRQEIKERYEAAKAVEDQKFQRRYEKEAADVDAWVRLNIRSETNPNGLTEAELEQLNRMCHADVYAAREMGYDPPVTAYLEPRKAEILAARRGNHRKIVEQAVKEADRTMGSSARNAAAGKPLSQAERSNSLGKPIDLTDPNLSDRDIERFLADRRKKGGLSAVGEYFKRALRSK